MFPSPQELNALNTMKSELHSGVTPQSFGLEHLKYRHLTAQAMELNSNEIDERSGRRVGVISGVWAKTWEVIAILTGRTHYRMGA